TLIARIHLGGRYQSRICEHATRRSVAARSDRVAGVPHRTYPAERARSANAVNARRTPPRVRSWPRWRAAVGDQRRELLGRPLGLALPLEFIRQQTSQVDEEFDIERRVREPRVGQRPRGPVGRRVVLLQRKTEQRLGQRRETDTLEAREPGGELGVEQSQR